MEFHGGGAGTGAGTGTGTRTGATRAEVAAASSASSAASTVGAAAVLRPADLIDGDTAKASAPQGKPPTAGVIPSHDHCSHTRITVTVEERKGRRREGKSKRKTMLLVKIISNQHLKNSIRAFSLRVFSDDPLYHLDYKNIIKGRQPT